MEPYRSYFPLSTLWLPETERMAKRVMVLPTGAAVDAESVETIAHILRLAVSHASRIRSELDQRRGVKGVDMIAPAPFGQDIEVEALG